MRLLLVMTQLRGLKWAGWLCGWLEIAQEVGLLTATEDRSPLNLIFKDSERLAFQNDNDASFASHPSAIDCYGG